MAISTHHDIRYHTCFALFVELPRKYLVSYSHLNYLFTSVQVSSYIHTLVSYAVNYYMYICQRSSSTNSAIRQSFFLLFIIIDTHTHNYLMHTYSSPCICSVEMRSSSYHTSRSQL